MLNADRRPNWAADTAASVEFYNRWFLEFAPKAYAEQRLAVSDGVKESIRRSGDLAGLTAAVLKGYPKMLSTLRMCCCPPIARERLAGLAGVPLTLVKSLEDGVVPPRAAVATVDANVTKIVHILKLLFDDDLFPWLKGARDATEVERERAATIVADRQCEAQADPIIRNAQEERMLNAVEERLVARGYTKSQGVSGSNLTAIPAGTYSFRLNVPVGHGDGQVNIPIDIVIQPKTLRPDRLPLLIEAKSAGDFTNVNKRRKEEATKMVQLKEKFGTGVPYLLFLCGYFNDGYLAYEASEGIDWFWEHRIEDLDPLIG